MSHENEETEDENGENGDNNMRKKIRNRGVSNAILTLFLPVPRWAGDNTDLPSNSNILKTAIVNIEFTECF